MKSPTSFSWWDRVSMNWVLLVTVIRQLAFTAGCGCGLGPGPGPGPGPPLDSKIKVNSSSTASPLNEYSCGFGGLTFAVVCRLGNRNPRSHLMNKLVLLASPTTL